MTEEFFSTSLSFMAQHKSAVIKQISDVITEYWEWFQSVNKEVLAERNAGLTTKKLAVVAPVLERKGRTKKASEEAQEPRIFAEEKYYVIWKDFSYSAYRKINPRTSKQITVSDPDNIINVVGKKCSWDFQRFADTEAKLAPLRQLLDTIHKTEVGLVSAQRKYVRRYHQQKEATK